MSIKDKLERMRRIYILANTPGRAHEWMIAHGFLEEGTWRDPRVVILVNREQIDTLVETADVHYQFLDKWREGHSPLFLQALWARIPHILQRQGGR